MKTDTESKTKVRLKTPKSAVLFFPGGPGGIATRMEFSKESLGKDFHCITWLSDSEMKALGRKNFAIVRE